jgi:glycosyltransferase involved in cell wall biosynthesis
VEKNRILFGFVGRLEEQKNPIRAMTAFAKITGACSNARLVMVGDGRLRPAIEAERTRLNVEKYIDVLGHCDARAIIPGLDCMIGSSDFETLPISFLEALAAGVPIVTTPVGGIEEAISEGQTGFVAKTPSVGDLANALVNFLNLSVAQRQKMAEVARERSSLFTSETMGDKYRSLYKQYVSP